MDEGNDSKAFGWSVLGLATLVAGLLGWVSAGFAPIPFEESPGGKALTALGTLLIIALFVERAQQVYISAWRTLGREQIDAEIAELQKTGSDAARLRELQSTRLEYRHKTRQMAFLGGMILGILISFAGPRILAEVMSVSQSMETWQATIFHGVDILITGGLIGGGSEGIHKLVTLITDFLDQTRARAKANSGSN